MEAETEASPQHDDSPDVEEYRFDLPIETDDDLRTFLKVAWGVVIPDVRVCEGHVSPFEAFSEAFFARYPVTVWKGSRKLAGKTFTLGTLGLTEAATLGCDVNVLGGSGEQSARVLETHEQLWRHPWAPRELLASRPAMKSTRLTNGAKLRALMASQTSARGGHPCRLRMDEVDEMDLELLKAALGQPKSLGDVASQVVLSSTHHYPNGTMSSVLDMAEEMNWPVRIWCWRETSAPPTGWLTLEEVERTRQTVPKETFRVEHDLGEPDPGALAIDPAAVKAMFRRELGVFKGTPGEQILRPNLRRARVYAHGADLAFVRDWCVFVTLEADVTPFQLAAFERFRRKPYPLVASRHDERCEMMPGESRYDKTGVGIAVGQLMAAPNTEGVTFTGGAGPNSRARILGDYVAACEKGSFVFPFIESLYQVHARVTNEALYGSGHPPDEIVACALAYRAAKRMRSGFTAPHSIGSKSYWHVPTKA